MPILIPVLAEKTVRLALPPLHNGGFAAPSKLYQIDNSFLPLFSPLFPLCFKLLRHFRARCANGSPRKNFSAFNIRAYDLR
jgi:hypothetical protein